MALACIVKVLCNWFLVAIPAFGITGAAYATVADIGVAAVLNMCFIYREIGYVIEVKVILKNIVSLPLWRRHVLYVLISSAISASSWPSSYRVSSDRSSTLAAWS